ncbi:MAG: hypothetical protein GXP40_10935 [Chloroflexi bacterium]|nr:hypothetical protein [Chloroflexota bacterium]
MRSRTVPQRGLNFEYLMWLFTRLSGLGMYILALVGVVSALVMGARTQMDMATLMRWTFMPNPSHVASSDIVNLDAWANAFWQIMGMLIVFFAGTHGLNGLRVVIEDYIGSTWLRPVLRGLIFLIWLFMIIVAVYVILAS